MLRSRYESPGYVPQYVHTYLGSFSSIALCNAKGEKGKGDKKRCTVHNVPYTSTTSLDMGTCKGLERESESRISVKGGKGGESIGARYVR